MPRPQSQGVQPTKARLAGLQTALAPHTRRMAGTGGPSKRARTPTRPQGADVKAPPVGGVFLKLLVRQCASKTPIRANEDRASIDDAPVNCQFYPGLKNQPPASHHSSSQLPVNQGGSLEAGETLSPDATLPGVDAPGPRQTPPPAVAALAEGQGHHPEHCPPAAAGEASSALGFPKGTQGPHIPPTGRVSAITQF